MATSGSIIFKFLDVCSAHYVTKKIPQLDAAKPVEPIQAEEFGDSPALALDDLFYSQS